MFLSAARDFCSLVSCTSFWYFCKFTPLICGETKNKFKLVTCCWNRLSHCLTYCRTLRTEKNSARQIFLQTSGLVTFTSFWKGRKKIDAYRTGKSKPSIMWATFPVRNSSEFSCFRHVQITVLAMDNSPGSELSLWIL